MIFPVTFTTVLLVSLFSLVLGAIWALTFGAAGKWRFELYGLDFGLGVVLSAILVGFTFGTFGDEITFYDNLMIIRKSSLLFLFGFGVLISLGVWLFLGAISISGLAVPFLAGMSFAAVVSAVGMQMFWPLMSPVYLGIGSLLLLAAVGLTANAHLTRTRQRDSDLLQKAVAAGIKGKMLPSTPAKGLMLAILGGLLLGLAQPIGIWTQTRDEIGIGAYSMGLLFAAAFIFAGPFFGLFFLNLPVQGDALSFAAWLKGTGRQHLLGIAGGMLWYGGLVTLLLAATATPKAGVSRALAFALTRGALILAGAVGVFLKGEFTVSPAARSQALIALTVAAAGLLVYGLAPA